MPLDSFLSAAQRPGHGYVSSSVRCKEFGSACLALCCDNKEELSLETCARVML